MAGAFAEKLSEPATRWRAAVLTITITPIVVASVRALARGWEPIGDNGILVVRAHDVLTRHNPLLGSWTSASIASGQPVNNPGPLYFDLIALPVKLLGHAVGLAIGVSIVNIAAVVFVVLVAERLAGRTAMLAFTAAVVVLEWSLGSELLFDVWQPNALVLPGLAFMVATWGMSVGRSWFVPWAIGIGSLLVQTHLSYVYLVPIAVLGATAAALATGALNRDVRRPLITTGFVVLLVWAQPIVEQFTSSGQGNLSSLITASGQETDRIGARLGVRLLAEVVATPPFIGRPSYTESIPAARVINTGENVPVIGLFGALAAIAILVTALAAIVWWSRRREEPAIGMLGAMSLVLLGACLVTLTLMPVGAIGLANHQMRWLWAVGAFVLATLVVRIATVVHSVLRRPIHGDAMLAALAALVALLAIPTYVSQSGPTTSRASLPTAQQLGRQLESLEDRGTVLFDTSTLAFAEPYSGYLFAELRDRGIPFVFEAASEVRQFGEGRRARGDADLRIWLVSGTQALEPLPPGVERVALVRGLSEAETAELALLERRVVAEVRTEGLTLNAAGRTAVEAGRLPRSALDADSSSDPMAAIGDFNLAVQQRWLVLPAKQAADFERLVELESDQFFGTVAVFAAPVDVRPPE